MMRTLSPSEAGTLMDCQMRHAFRYTGVATGGTCLKSKVPHSRLRAGRAWGAAVADWHQYGDPWSAARVMRRTMFADVQEITAGGGHVDIAEVFTLLDELEPVLAHYMATTPRLHLFGAERELLTRVRHRWQLQAFVDGLAIVDGSLFLVEFKLRMSDLSDLHTVEMNRQVRWEAWAVRELTGQAPAGVIFDERLNAVPNPVRFNKDGSVSKVQSCDVDEYQAAFMPTGGEPDADVLAKLTRKQWGVQHYVFFTDRELDEAGREVRSVSQMVELLEAEVLHPVRNATMRTCGGCEFRDICPDPSEVELVDALFNRVPAKRHRTTTERGART